MRSIRTYLAFGLAVGFLLLLSITSFLVYVISKQIIRTDFDARLLANAQAVCASITQRESKLDIDWKSLPANGVTQGKEIEFFQVLDSSGHFIEGIESLQHGALPQLNKYKYNTMTSADGGKIRVVTLAFQPEVEQDDEAATPPGMRKTFFVVVGNSCDQMERSLHRLASVLAVMTLITFTLGVGLVLAVLHMGLRPLNSLGLDVAKIDAFNLDNRLSIDTLPIELVPIANKLNDLLARLEVSFARERRFSADVSHELRTPIAELRSLSDVMLRQPNLTAEVRQAFQDVQDSSCQMQSLVAALLEIVRGEQSSPIMETESANLVQLVELTWKTLEGKARDKDIYVSFRMPDEIIVTTDQKLLRLVLNNLLSNAVNYTPNTGIIEISAEARGDRILVSILNSSRNVTAQDLSHFFERFWRKDKVRGNSENMGLGLSITQLLCRRLQIKMIVTSPKPDFVCFWLDIPVSAPIKEVEASV